MKIYQLFTHTVLIGTLLLAGACEGFLDVNEDPTAPLEVSENLQLSALLGVFSYQVIGNDPARTTNLWVQQLTYSGGVPTSDNYDYKESDSNSFWNGSYTEVLNNARTLNETAIENDSHNFAGISKVIQAWSYATLTDLFNEIPYSEAFNPVNTTPAYDTQEFVYSEIIKLLEAALVDFAENSPVNPGVYDLLYSGDMDKWEKLTHTLLARYHLRLSNAPGYSATEQATKALAALGNGFDSNDDDADFAYYDNSGEENPWYQFAIDGKWDTRTQVSGHYIDLLTNLNDPRLPIQARPVGAVDNNGIVPGFTPNPAEYEGNENGVDGGGASSWSSIGAYYSAADASLNWASYAETKFIEAEARFILDGAGAAQNVYNDAITASMDKLGVDSQETSDYLNALPLLTDSQNPLNEIITQKYIANFLSLENFNDWRRTGYPELEPAAEPATPTGIIPVRYPYPGSELSNNATTVDDTGVKVGYSSLEMKVWWDAD
ncbi:MAG: SusD/RagB family nutrient-binding outer membrane lipoprotein [Balneolales bacterium]